MTVRPGAPASGYGTSPYLNQETLLGAKVYTPATFQLRTSKGALVQPGPDGFRVTGTRAKRQASTYGLTASCPAGTDIYFWAPNFNGNVNLPSQTKVGFVGRMPTHSAAVERIGATPAGGRFTLWVRAMERGTVPPEAIGCLDRGRLAAAEQRLATAGATHVQVTDDGISAQLSAGSHGFAVVAAPAITGWSCSAGGGSAAPGHVLPRPGRGPAAPTAPPRSPAPSPHPVCTSARRRAVPRCWEWPRSPGTAGGAGAVRAPPTPTRRNCPPRYRRASEPPSTTLPGAAPDVTSASAAGRRSRRTAASACARGRRRSR